MADTEESVNDEADLDPRIQEELNILNQTSTDINKLENELDEARCNYKITFTEASQKLAQAAEKRRKQIQRARAYFELKEEAKKAQGESLKAARQYQSAIGVYRAAKETVTLAEQRLMQKGEGNLSAAWQEMMNHATMRVMDAEKEKRESEQRHQLVTSQCAECEKKLKQLEKKFGKSISKAGPYFEVKQQLDIKLQHQKQNVTDLQAAIRDTKVKYSNALRNLEKISEEIHQSRRDKIMLMFPRQPGVGAESGSSLSSMVPDITLEELQCVSEYSDSAMEDDDPDAKNEGVSFSACYTISDQNGSDAILDSKSVKNQGIESKPQTCDEKTENNDLEHKIKDLSLKNTTYSEDLETNISQLVHGDELVLENKDNLGLEKKSELENNVEVMKEYSIEGTMPEKPENLISTDAKNVTLGNSDEKECTDRKDNGDSYRITRDDTDERLAQNRDKLLLQQTDKSVNKSVIQKENNLMQNIQSST